MAWIESHQSLSRHRKTLRAAALLKVDRHKLLGHLHELWWWALDNVPPDGSLGALSYEEIAQGADWPTKDAERFVRTLLAAGFLDADDHETENNLRLHDWYDYAGKLNDRRDKERERSRQRRSGEQRPPDGPPTTNGRPAVDRPTTAGTVPNRTQPNQTVPSAPNGAVLAPAERVPIPKPKREHEPIDEPFKTALIAEFAAAFGSREAVEHSIEKALNHVALRKAIAPRVYLRGWVRDDAEKRKGAHAGPSPQPFKPRGNGIVEPRDVPRHPAFLQFVSREAS